MARPLKPLTKEDYIKKLDKAAMRCEGENYHSEAGFLWDLMEKLQKTSDDADWKDIVVREVLKRGPY